MSRQTYHAQIIKSGVHAGVFLMNNLMNLYAKTGSLVDARQVFDEMPVKNPSSWNTIISAYAKQGQIGNARRLFEQMPKPNSVSWTAIMVGYNQMGRFENAVKLFVDMICSKVMPTQYTFTVVLASCAAMKSYALISYYSNLATKKDTKAIENQDSNTFVERRNFLLRLGYIENSDELSKALKKFWGRGDQLQERFDCLVQAGLDYNVVSSMIKRAPSVLNQTKDILEKKIDCLHNHLGYPLEVVVVFPSYLCYDIQRINLRFSMYLWLLERGAAKPKLSLSTIFACSDARFVKYFVHVHPEGVSTWESLKNSLNSRK